MKNTYAVITTINPPTDSVRAWAKLLPVRTIVVGDVKTPDEWSCEGAHYRLLCSSDMDGSLEKLIGPNKYQRKMLGYVGAIRAGAEVIVDTDDDNEPIIQNVDFPWEEHFLTSQRSGWVNPYAHYGEPGVWPRGLPLQFSQRSPYFSADEDREPLHSMRLSVGIWQGLAQGDADVSAIWRMVVRGDANFQACQPNIVLSEGTLAPINSQATLFRRECFPLLYLPCTVSMRVCDILRGYVAQPIMWAAGYRLGFCGPIVRQKRNRHDLMDDFEQELPLYRGMGEDVIERVSAAVKPELNMDNNLLAAYRALVGVHGIGDESEAIEEWLDCLPCTE